MRMGTDCALRPGESNREVRDSGQRQRDSRNREECDNGGVDQPSYGIEARCRSNQVNAPNRSAAHKLRETAPRTRAAQDLLVRKRGANSKASHTVAEGFRGL